MVGECLHQTAAEARLAASATRRLATISSGSRGFFTGACLRRGFGRQASASATRSESNPMKKEKQIHRATAASAG
jgi:hypothetical protein